MKSIASLVALLTIGAAQPRALAPQKFVGLNPGTFVSLGTSVAVRRTVDKGGFPHYRLAITFPNRKLAQVRIDDHGYQSVSPVFAIGRLSASSGPVIWVETFSGGAHCCRQPRIIAPSRTGVTTVDLGSWDGENSGLWPDDWDGDGQRDLIFADNSFLYSFAPYAASYAPPRIYNVVGGEMIDVSTKSGFRKIYVSWMKNAWQDCLAGGRGGCAAYIASAARIGRLDVAWAEMLQHYDRSADWELPLKGCRIKGQTLGDCPEKDQVRFRDYPEALRSFLVKTGYLKD